MYILYADLLELKKREHLFLCLCEFKLPESMIFTLKNIESFIDKLVKSKLTLIIHNKTVRIYSGVHYYRPELATNLLFTNEM